MTFTLIKNKINILIFILTPLIMVSCSSDDNPKNDDYLSIPDNTFETMLIDQGIDSDGIINQQLLKSDAENITHLDLDYSAHYGEIYNLTGIEGFLNLKNLIATQHSIETINLSFNTKLDTLYLSGNHLTTIDVSSNKNLILLDVQSNLLTSITGLAEATQLKDLDLSWNYLETLSIPNENLEILHLSNNDLTALNINNAVNVKNILLNTNLLTSLDVSTNTLLETLLIPDNNIESINLENNSNLAYLHLFSNSFTSLDVSNNQELVSLKVDRNPDLTCVKIQSGQYIPTVQKSDYQTLNNTCN